jgi:uncharacterized protein YigE (DUF2233 family)
MKKFSRFFLAKILFFLLIFTATSVSAATEWQVLAPGIEYSRLPAPLVNPSGLLHAFRIDLRHYQLRLATAQAQQAPVDSVKNMAQVNNAVIGVNGGFFNPDAKPLGLRVNEGEMTSNLRSISWWGVFYIQNGKPNIKSYRDFRFSPKMSFAIQSGPRLVVNGSIPHLKPGVASRTALGITKDKKIILVVTEMGLRIATARLAEILQHPESKGGLDCAQALNLDGGSSTQLYVKLPSFSLYVPGFNDVADAILVVPKGV